MSFPTGNSSTNHEGDDEDEGQREADDEGDDAHHQERVGADWAVWYGRPEERGVEDESPVGHEQEARQDGDKQGGPLRWAVMMTMGWG